LAKIHDENNEVNQVSIETAELKNEQVCDRCGEVDPARCRFVHPKQNSEKSQNELVVESWLFPAYNLHHLKFQ
jgi:hypothetical protein